MSKRSEAVAKGKRRGRLLRGGVALCLVLAAWGCAGETYPSPGYKSRPAFDTRQQTPPQTAALSGLVYAAESPTIDAKTQLPEGYRRLPGEEGRVAVRIPGKPGETRVVPIKDGAYMVPDLPLGVTLEVVASCPGYGSRRQQVQIVLPAGRRLNFDYKPDGISTMLIRLKEGAS